jgi:hypothetical protein
MELYCLILYCSHPPPLTRGLNEVPSSLNGEDVVLLGRTSKWSSIWYRIVFSSHIANLEPKKEDIRFIKLCILIFTSSRVIGTEASIINTTR